MDKLKRIIYNSKYTAIVNKIITDSNSKSKSLVELLRKNYNDKSFYFYIFSIPINLFSKKIANLLCTKLLEDIYRDVDINKILQIVIENIDSLCYIKFMCNILVQLISKIFENNIEIFPIKYSIFLEKDNLKKKIDIIDNQQSRDQIILQNIEILEPEYIVKIMNNQQIMLHIALKYDFSYKFTECLSNFIF